IPFNLPSLLVAMIICSAIPLAYVLFNQTYFYHPQIKKNNLIVILIFYALFLVSYLPYGVIAGDYEALLRKINGLLFSPIIGLLAVGFIITQYSYRDIRRSFIAIGLIFLCLTVVYKFAFGFSDRQVRFFLNGPIVFSWLCGTIFLFTKYNEIDRNKLHYFLLFFLFISMIWSGSKGPILALIVTLLIYGKIRNILVFGTFVSALIWGLVTLNLFPERFLVFYEIYQDPRLVNEISSFSIRMQLFLNSISYISENPIIGVGLTNFASISTGHGQTYPHNLLLEAAVEAGVISALFLLLMLLTLFFSFTKWSLSRAALIFLLMCTMISGDLSYVRFVLLVPFLAMKNSRRQAVF
ncbi:O-antigen ligase family protein, partial [Alphaproteobacteria bacterium]|nr:O-antigen ligase family protein [Alphaproteobacteria bacterium]